MKINKTVIVFAKQKYGLEKVLSFLKANFRRVDVFLGVRGDAFPKAALRREYDICISYMSPWIIPTKFLDGVRDFSINFHPGPPEYRGIGCTNFAVYHGEKRYGVTAHLMAQQVDAGKIIAVGRFDIKEKDTLVTLTDQCYKHILKLFFKVFRFYLKHGELPRSDEMWIKRLYTRKELNGLCVIRPGMTRSEVERRIKATDFPNMPKASVTLFGHRFEYKESR